MSSIIGELSNDLKRFSSLVSLSVQWERSEKYLHWHDLLYLKPPRDLSHKEWWFLIKQQRTRSKHIVPLKNKKSQAFSYDLEADPILERLYNIDRGSGGPFSTPNEISNPGTRNSYLVRSLIEEAITSSQLEGAATTRKVAKEMIRTGRKPSDKSEQMILNNYLTMEYVRKLADKPLSLSLILDIHRRITDKTLEKHSEEGRLRLPNEQIRVYWEEDNQVLHDPPKAEELEERINAMCEFANGKMPKGFIHPVIRSIILHFWLAYDHPFVDGNGRVARALFYWSMIRHGFELFEYISISEIIKKSPGQYRDAFLYTETDDNDLTYFILFHLKVMERALTTLHQYIKQKRRKLAALENKIRAISLNHRQRAIITHALRNPDHLYTIKSHQTSNRIAYATARKDLFDLSDKKILNRKKTGKEYYFVPTRDIENNLAQLAEEDKFSDNT